MPILDSWHDCCCLSTWSRRSLLFLRPQIAICIPLGPKDHHRKYERRHILHLEGRHGEIIPRRSKLLTLQCSSVIKIGHLKLGSEFFRRIWIRSITVHRTSTIVRMRRLPMTLRPSPSRLSISQIWLSWPYSGVRDNSKGWVSAPGISQP